MISSGGFLFVGGNRKHASHDFFSRLRYKMEIVYSFLIERNIDAIMNPDSGNKAFFMNFYESN